MGLISEKTILLLQIVAKKGELSSLKKFLASPYFNSNQRYLKLLDALRKYAPTFDEIDEEAVCKKVYPKQKNINEASFRTFIHNYKNLLKEFLAQQEYRAKSKKSPNLGSQRMDYLEALKNEPSAKKLFKKEIKRAFDFIESYKEENSEILGHKFTVLQLAFRFQQVNSEEGIALADVQDASLDFQIVSYLKFVVPAFADQVDLGTRYNFSYLDVVLNYLADNIETRSSLLKLYYWLTLFWRKDGSIIGLGFLIKQLEIHKDSVSKYELQQIYFSVTNYYSLKIREDRRFYLPILLKLFKKRLENELFFSWADEKRPQLSPRHYKNIIRMAIVNEEPKQWIFSFIKAYKPLLIPSKDTDIVLVLVQSWAFFLQEQYIEAIRNIHCYKEKNQLKITYFNINYYELIIKCLYEINLSPSLKRSLGQDSFLQDFLDFSEENEFSIVSSLDDKLFTVLGNFRVYLDRNSEKINPTTDRNCKAFIKVVTGLLVLELQAELKKIIDQNPGIREVNWLLKKVTEHDY